MPNLPMTPRYKEWRRPPRYERLQELAAFWLGFEPHRLWHDLAFTDADKPSTECHQRLLDLPVLLSPYFDAYATVRFYSIVQQCCQIFVEQPISKYHADGPETAPETFEMEDGIVNQISGLNVQGDVAEVDAGVSPRAWWMYLAKFCNEDPAVFRLLRLARAVGDRLDMQSRPWFDFGRVLGSCPYYLQPSVFDPKVDIGEEIKVVASRTDFGGHGIPDLTLKAWGGRENRKNKTFPAHYAKWVKDEISAIAGLVKDFLEDEPSLALSTNHNLLWFLGCPVELTPSETKMLDGIARAGNETVTREQVVRSLDDAADVTVGIEFDLHKADKHLSSIISKICERLEASRSAYFRGNKAVTKKWLREHFIVPVPGAGWRRGSLWARLVTNSR